METRTKSTKSSNNNFKKFYKSNVFPKLNYRMCLIWIVNHFIEGSFSLIYASDQTTRSGDGYLLIYLMDKLRSRRNIFKNISTPYFIFVTNANGSYYFRICQFLIFTAPFRGVIPVYGEGKRQCLSLLTPPSLIMLGDPCKNQ